jgi:ribosomal protein S18 acetylase RimI-like enzyme
MIADGLSIRKVKKQDLKAILDLIRQHQKYDVEFAKRYYAMYFQGDKMIEEDEVFVAVIRSEIVGVIGYCRDYLSTDYSYWLGWFMVSQQYRRQKIGSRLFARVEKELKRYPSIGRLFVTTEAGNTRAISFYKKHGFTREGLLKDYYADGENEMILGKNLRA